MGRILLAEERLRPYVDSFFTKDQWAIGLIVGQLTYQKDYAIHMVRTPPEEDADSEPSSTRVKRKVLSLDMIDENWVAFHAKQVLRMLPGGLEVIGVFALAPPAMMQTASASKLRQTLFAVHKMLAKEEAMLSIKSTQPTERYLLQICSVTRKLTCRTFDAADPKCAARPADWKYQTFASRWLSMQTSLSLDVVVPVPTSDIGDSLMKHIQKGLGPFCHSVESAVTAFDDQVLDSDTPLYTDSSKQQNKRSRQHKHSSEEGPPPFSVSLFTNLITNNNTKEPEVTSCCAKLLIRGTVQGRAYVHGKSTVQEASEAVKKDVIRSLFSRCELLCEDLLQSEEEQDPRILYETPVRVFAQIAGTPLYLCDYLFQDEGASDLLERFHDVTDLPLTEEDLETEVEPVPVEEDLIRPDIPSPKTLDSHQSSSSQFKAYLGVVVGGAVAALAAGLSLLYLGQD